MKVLHVISGGDSGGAKTHLISLAKQLSKKIDMKIVCFMEGDFYLEAKKIGLPVELIKQKSRSDIRSLKKLMSYIKREKFDIIHAHGARANFALFLLKSKIKIPMITTVHSDYRSDFKGNLYKHVFFTTLNAVALRFFNYYVGVSKEFKQMLVERNFREDKIFSIYNGIDFEEEIEIIDKKSFAKRHNILDELDKKFVGIIARLDPVKGIDIFIKGASEILKKYDNVHFIIAGDGQEKERLKELLKSLDIEDNVTFLGFIRDIPSFLNLIDINVLTSHSESFSYAILEGARQKKACVSSNVGGLKDLLVNKKTGLLFEPGDYKEYAKCVLELLEDDKLNKKYGDALYKHTLENFSNVNMADSHIKIYEKILDGEVSNG